MDDLVVEDVFAKYRGQITDSANIRSYCDLTLLCCISSVRPLELDTKDGRFYRLQANEHVDDYKLAVGDVLFVRCNGTKELVGVCALVDVVTGALLYPDK